MDQASTLIFNFSGTRIRTYPIRAVESLLIVCHCHRATEREIRRAVREGASSLREIGAHCGAASACGGCAEAVLDILSTELGGAPRAIETIRSPALS